MTSDTDASAGLEALPDWHPRQDLETGLLANALEHIRRVAYMHWLGNAFDPEHMELISLLAAQALCGQPIEAPVDTTSEAYRARSDEYAERIAQLFDDALEHAATVVAPHEHVFQPDPARINTHYCTAARCRTLISDGAPHHPYRELLTPEPERQLIAVDESLADLVENLWKAGVTTFASCQGGCCEDAAGRVGQSWLIYGTDAGAAAQPLLAELPNLHSDGQHEGRCKVWWDAPVRCPEFEREKERHDIGTLIVGARVTWKT